MSRPRATVVYRVMRASFFLPSSPPSFCRRSRAGMAMVSSWTMMEELIYGWTDRARTVAWEKAEPDRVL